MRCATKGYFVSHVPKVQGRTPSQHYSKFQKRVLDDIYFCTSTGSIWFSVSSSTMITSCLSICRGETKHKTFSSAVLYFSRSPIDDIGLNPIDFMYRQTAQPTNVQIRLVSKRDPISMWPEDCKYTWVPRDEICLAHIQRKTVRETPTRKPEPTHSIKENKNSITTRETDPR